MKLRFTKMQGLGNDFVVLDGVRQRVEIPSDYMLDLPVREESSRTRRPRRSRSRAATPSRSGSGIALYLQQFPRVRALDLALTTMRRSGIKGTPLVPGQVVRAPPRPLPRR